MQIDQNQYELSSNISVKIRRKKANLKSFLIISMYLLFIWTCLRSSLNIYAQYSIHKQEVKIISKDQCIRSCRGR